MCIPRIILASVCEDVALYILDGSSNCCVFYETYWISEIKNRRTKTAIFFNQSAFDIHYIRHNTLVSICKLKPFINQYGMLKYKVCGQLFSDQNH